MNVIPESDGTLVTRVRGGDEAAMTAIYDRYSSVVYSVALRVLGDTGSAEDVAQEVFMQLWRNPAMFDGSRGSLAPWLAVISRHRAIDFLRKRRPETDIDDVVVASDSRLDDEASRNLMLGKVRQVLGGLPVEQREAMEMAFFQGLTHSEIAERSGQPLGTIKTRIRTALLTLRKALA